MPFIVLISGQSYSEGIACIFISYVIYSRVTGAFDIINKLKAIMLVKADIIGFTVNATKNEFQFTVQIITYL